MAEDKVNILLVDDQPAKLLSYEVILGELNENLLKAPSASEALQTLLKTDVAVLLVDVCMPDLDGFQFAAMVREHPRFRNTAIIFISAIHLSDGDSLKGYELGAVDYVPVPVVPELLRAKVRVFVDLYRKSRQLEQLNADLEGRVAARTKELEAAIKRQELLSLEVDHRARNALAVVQSIVRLTRADNIEDYAKAVNGRIRAMANAHTLLSETRWAGAELARLIDEELAPYQSSDRAQREGPSINLRPPVAQALAMAIHELATNAAKHGALSKPGGRVGVTWQAMDDAVELVWQEFGGPVSPPAPDKGGFGMKVIEASVMSQSKGEVEFSWTAQGLRCRLRIPEAIEEFAVPAAVPPMRAAGERAQGAGLNGATVMLVEDEALIAMMIVDVLAENGATVLGPFNTLAQAMACEAPFDVALLDVNVNGETVYPLAQRLRDNGQRFLFATGYDDRALDEGFDGATVLQKPIEPAALVEALERALADNDSRPDEPAEPRRAQAARAQAGVRICNA